MNLNHPIRRIEVRDLFVRIYLTLKGSRASFRKVSFYLITMQNNDRSVYKGILPTESKSFPLVNTVTGETIGEADFHGNRYGGDIVIPKKVFFPADRMFVQIEQKLGVFDESEWVDIVPGCSILEGSIALIPCYDVAPYCEAVIREATHFASKVVVVDDGSKDGTKEILTRLAKEFPEKITVLTHQQNQGKGGALITGFKYILSHSDCKSIITLDGDTQHRSSDIPYLAHEIDLGAELVIGSRHFKLMPFVRQLSNSIIAALLRLKYPNAPKDTQSGFRAFSRNFAQEIVKTISEGHYEIELKCLLLALRQHRRIKIVTISTLYLGKNLSSHFSTFKDSFRILKVFFCEVLGRKL